MGWKLADNTIDETTPRTINSGEQLALDTIFNGLVNSSKLNRTGRYRIYAALRDPYGNILICDDTTEIKAYYEFEIDFT